MTITSTAVRCSYAGDGASQLFPTTFPFFGSAEIQVARVDGAGVVTYLILNTDYTVSGGNGAIGTVNMTLPPAVGTMLLIWRLTNRLQTIDFVANDNLSAAALERGFDRAAALAAEDADQFTRTLRAPINDPAGLSLVIPAAGVRAGLSLAFDSVGNLVAVPAGTTLAATAATPPIGDNSLLIANTAWVRDQGFLTAAPSLDLSGSDVTSPGGVARTLAQLVGSLITVRNYGALGNGSDDLARINLAMAHCLSLGGGTVWLEPGTYQISGTLVVPARVKLRGFAVGACIINAMASFSAGDIVQFGDGVHQYDSNGGGIEDIQITTSVSRTSGAAIAVWGTNGVQVRRVVTAANMFDGIAIRGGLGGQYSNVIEDVILVGGARYGMVLGETTNLLTVQGVWITRGTVAGFAIGCMIYNASGCYWNGTEYQVNGVGVETYPGAGQFAKALYFVNLICDTNAGNGLSLLTNGGSVVEVIFAVSWFATNSHHGVQIGGSGTIRGVKFSACFAFNNQWHGISLESGSFAEFDNVSAVNNSLASSHTYCGLAVAAGLNDWSVVGGRYGTGSEVTIVQQGYGIGVVGNSNRYRVVGADLSGNAQPYFDGTTGLPERKLSQCVGAVFEFHGTAAILTGTQSITVPHYMSLLPTKGDFLVSPHVDPGACGVTRLWISAVDAVNLTVSCEANTVNNLEFSFHGTAH